MSKEGEELLALRLKLEAVDLAIGKLRGKGAGVLQNESGTTQVRVPPSQRNKSIDTDSRQMGCCPNCFLDMPLGLLRAHMANSCEVIVMECPEPGCAATFPRSDLKRHLSNECTVTKLRRKLILQAQLRKEEKNANAVDGVSSPFRDSAGAHDFVYRGLDETGVELDAGPEPAGLFTCPQCEESMAFSKSHAHGESCRARVIFCPNRLFGCDSEVTFSTLPHHLRADCSVEIRKSDLIARCNQRKELVRCVGCGDLFPLGNLLQHEEVECPNRKVACRNAHLGCQVVLRASMRKAHEEVDNAKARVRTCLYLAGTGAHIALHEDDIIAPWTAEFWLYRPSAKEGAKQHIRAALMLIPAFIDAFSIECRAKDYVDSITVLLGDKTVRRTQEEMEDAMDLLADAVDILEDSAVAAVEASKALGCALGAAQSCFIEFLPNSQRTLQFLYPSGANPYKSPPHGTIAQEVVSLRMQPPGEASLDRRNEKPVDPNATPVSRRDPRPVSEPAEANVSGDVDGKCATRDVKGNEIQELNDIESVPELGFADRESELLADTSVLSEPEPSHAAKKRPWCRPESFSHGSALAQLLSLSSEYQPPTTYNIPSVGTPFTPHAPTPQLEGSFAATPEEFDDASVPPAAQFLIHALRRGRRGGAGHGVLSPRGFHTQLSWADWWNVTLLLADALWDDKTTLSALEQSSGLLGKQTPVAAKSVKDHAEESDLVAAEMKAFKKDKSRLRREAKMKKGQQAASNQDVAENGKNIVESDAGLDTEATEVERKRREKRDQAERTRLNRKNLRDRLTEAGRAACGAELLFSSSAISSGSANRICLEMVPCPISWKPKQDAVKPAYIHRQQQEHQKNSKEASTGGGLDPRDGAIEGKMGVVLAECPAGGPGCFSFPCSVPRERWCHLALVASPEPNKRLLLYLDGLMKGSLKDCAFPLPMYSIGAPSTLSFSAALLDVRLWAKMRSQLEIQVTMSRLLQLEVVTSRLTHRRKRPGNPPVPREVELSTSPVVPGRPDLGAENLVLWFPFEDGFGASRVLDVTEQRFPTPLSRNLMPPPMLPQAHLNPTPKARGVTSSPLLHTRSFSREPDFAIIESDAASFPEAEPVTTNVAASPPPGQRRRFKAPAGYKPFPWIWLDADGIPLPNAPPLPPGETDRTLPVPAFSSKGVCPFELRRLRLAQRGRQLYKEINCPLGCDEVILKKDVKFHVAHECSRRLVSCRFPPLCTGTFPISQRVSHEIPGPNCECAYIRDRTERARQADFQHELVSCDNCAEEVTRRRMAQHKRLMCSHRDVVCYMGCGHHCQAFNLSHHTLFECPLALSKAFRVQRARMRTGYSRPWALKIAYDASDRDVTQSGQYGVEEMYDAPTTVVDSTAEPAHRRPPDVSVQSLLRDRDVQTTASRSKENFNDSESDCD